MDKLKNSINWNVIVPLVSIIFFAGSTFMTVQSNQQTINRLEDSINNVLTEQKNYAETTRKISVNNSKDLVLVASHIERNAENIVECKGEDMKADDALDKLTESINRLNIILTELDTWKKIQEKG